MSETAEPGTALHRFIRERFGSPSAIYGLIVYTAAVAAISDQHSQLGEVILQSVYTLVIFFIAHVFAHTLAEHGRLTLPRAIASAVRHSVGMLYSSLPSTIVLLIALSEGWTQDDAVDGALIVAIVMLGILGYSAYARRGSRHIVRWIGAVGTAAIGFLVLVLELATH